MLKYILNFCTYFPESKHFFLTRNFRSTARIVDMANASMECQTNRIPKMMVAHHASELDKKPVVRYFSSDDSHIVFIISEIQNLMNRGIAYDEIAIISPINNILYSIEEKLTKAEIPNVCLEGRHDSRVMKTQGHVCLGTIHKAKGLEWDVVFLVGMSDDLVPKLKNPKSVEDNRRLFYVGITRPRKELIITYTAKLSHPFVSRYIAELPITTYNFKDFSPKYISGTSELDSFYIEPSVSKLVSLLDAQDYNYIRNKILPDLDVKKVVIHSPRDYGVLVKKEGLHIDFANFLKTILYHSFKHTSFKYAREMMAHIKLTRTEYQIYRKYLFSIKHNIDHGKMDMTKVSSKDQEVFKEVVREIKIQAKEYSILPSTVPVFHEGHIFPSLFFTNLAKKMNTLSKAPTKDVMDELWEVSKCETILCAGRKRLLYKSVTGSDVFEDNHELILTALAEFKKYLEGEGLIECSKPISYNDITGIIDVLTDAKLFSIKLSTRENVDLAWIIELLLQKSIFKFNYKSNPVSNVAVYNPLQGCIFELNVLDWKKEEELVSYIMSKKQKLST